MNIHQRLSISIQIKLYHQAVKKKDTHYIHVQCVEIHIRIIIQRIMPHIGRYMVMNMMQELYM